MDIGQVKENLRKIAAQGGTDADLTEYANAAGYTAEQIRNYNPDSYSLLGHAKHLGRAAGEGATFGLADILAGGTNILSNNLAEVTHGENIGQRIKGAGKLALNLTPLPAQFKDRLIPENKKLFKTGRRDFVKEQEAYAGEHPYLNMAGEMAGAIGTMGAGGAGKLSTAKGLSLGEKVWRGGKTGAAVGGAYGAGSGLTQDVEGLSAEGAVGGGILGALFGGVLGGAMPVAGKAAGGAYGAVSRPVKGVFNFLKNPRKFYENKAFTKVAKASSGKLNQSIEKGVPLIDTADEALMDMAVGTKGSSTKAAQIYRDYDKGRRAVQNTRINELVDNNLGGTGYGKTIEAIEENAKKAYQPLYEKAMARGKIDIAPDEYISEYVQKVRSAKGIKNQVAHLPDNDMRVLDYAKQFLDDDISKAMRGGDKTTARGLMEIKNNLVGQMDRLNPEYAPARQAFADKSKLLEAAELGRDIKKMTPQEVKALSEQLTSAEKQALLSGVREDILTNLARANKSGNENLAMRSLDNNTIAKLRALGVDIESAAMAERKAVENLNRLHLGSQTAEKQQSIGRAVMNPRKQTKGFIARTIDRAFSERPEDIARIMTDPKYAAQLRARLADSNIHAARGLGKSNFNALRAAGPLTRLGHPDARVSAKTLHEINKSPNPETYSYIPAIRDIYATGEYRGPLPNHHLRKDKISQWHYFRKPINKRNVELQVGEDRQGRLAYFLDEDTKRRTSSAPQRSFKSPTNSITQNPADFKPFNFMDFVKTLQSPYYGGVAGGAGANAKRRKERK